jgi:hypothetical protein
MAGASLLNSELYRAKLRTLTPAQQSIENLSTWCMFYHSDHKHIVEVWHEEFQQVIALPVVDRATCPVFLAAW